ncbi:hypothetical protein PIB30_094925 [Stylosanthes scabra]|uniref:Uncharacterized protein n=1 Tax=Stylosanthes scabra TaxID=79078 RepID=A0ABU6WTU0_9FABA|nr:hypothetical protein [Stylosanthes scabra]
MGRTKSTAKKAKQGEMKVEPPPQGHPMAKFFTNLADFNNYIMNFAPRKEITPRYLDLDLLHSQNFNELYRILVRQDFLDFVRLRDYYYPDLVAIAYTSLTMEFEEGLKGPNCINYATLRQMGRDLAQEQPQQAPQDQAGPSEQEHQAGPSEQPSMRDMMQVLLRIEQHQANMDTHLTRVDQRLSRIEQYFEIDEDEDQD